MQILPGSSDDEPVYKRIGMILQYNEWPNSTGIMHYLRPLREKAAITQLSQTFEQLRTLTVALIEPWRAIVLAFPVGRDRRFSPTSGRSSFTPAVWCISTPARC
jgi:hypothetical protein